MSDIPRKCTDDDAGGQSEKEERAQVDRRALMYVLWGTEVDSLRTELNFIPLVTDFADLEILRDRASALMDMSPKCLPRYSKATPVYTAEWRDGTVAEGKVIAGLTALAVAERMATLAASAEDRNISAQVQKMGEYWLRVGWDGLKPKWTAEVNTINAKDDWSDRIFSASEWQRSAELAIRALSSLRQGN